LAGQPIAGPVFSLPNGGWLLGVTTSGLQSSEK